MRKRFLLFVSLFISIALLGCGLYTIPIILSAFYEPDDSCPEFFHSMFVSIEYFPDGWNIGNPHEEEAHGIGILDSCSIEFLVRNGVAFEDINEYKSIFSAKEDYQKKLVSEYIVREGLDSTWKIPNNININDISADESYLACADIGYVPMCRLLARYGKYIVIFNTHMNSEFMTIDNLEKVIYGLDGSIHQD